MFGTVACFTATRFQLDPVLSSPSLPVFHSSQGSPQRNRRIHLRCEGRRFCRDSHRQMFGKRRGLHRKGGRRGSVRRESASESETTVEDNSSTKQVSNLSENTSKDKSSASADVAAVSHLDLLGRLTSNSSGRTLDNASVGNLNNKTIAEQLASKAVSEAQEVSLPLVKKTNLDRDDPTIAQKRNIRRQQYLDKVAKRDDGPFFLTVALFLILPPAIILCVAFATGFIHPIS